MPGDEYDALVGATRWTALTPCVDPDRPAGNEKIVKAAEAMSRVVEKNTLEVMDDQGNGRIYPDLNIEAQQYLKEGRFWRARTLLEHHALAQQVYNKALVFPPTQEYLTGPAKLKR